MKATHSGTCQLCGRFQKLPGNRLSTHGYTVEWGYFFGTCPGSHGLPFEISKDLIEGAITSAETRIHGLRREIGALRARTDTLAWVSKYRPTTWSQKGGNYYEQETILERNPRTYTDINDENPTSIYTVYYIARKDEEKDHFPSPGAVENEKTLSLCGEASNARDTAVAFNERYIRARLQPEIDQLVKYIAWQRGRIANWAPAPEKLVPVSKA